MVYGFVNHVLLMSQLNCGGLSYMIVVMLSLGIITTLKFSSAAPMFYKQAYSV